MELTKHNHLIGKAAEKLAGKADLEVVDPVYFSTPKRREQLKRAKEMGDAVVNDHDYEGGEEVEEGYSTDDSSPLRNPGSINSDNNNDNDSNKNDGDCEEDMLLNANNKLSSLQRMFLSEESSPDSGSGITDLIGNGIFPDTEISDSETTEYDKKMTKKLHNISEKYNASHDLKEIEKKEKVEVIEMLQGNEKEKVKGKDFGKSKNALEREREREKEKLLESFYPGSTGELILRYIIEIKCVHTDSCCPTSRDYFHCLFIIYCAYHQFQYLSISLTELTYVLTASFFTLDHCFHSLLDL